MGRLKPIVVLSIVVLIELCGIKSSYGQDKQKAAPGPPQTSNQLKKKQWLKQRKKDRATAAALKAHMKDQTKAVRKRMKKDAKKAKKNNNKETH